MILGLNRNRCMQVVLALAVGSMFACGSDSKSEGEPAPGTDKVVTQTNPNQQKQVQQPAPTQGKVCNVYQKDGCGKNPDQKTPGQKGPGQKGCEVVQQKGGKGVDCKNDTPTQGKDNPGQVCDPKSGKNCGPGQNGQIPPPAPRAKCEYNRDLKTFQRYNYMTQQYEGCGSNVIARTEVCESVDSQEAFCYFDTMFDGLNSLEVVVDVQNKLSQSACTLNESYGSGNTEGAGYIWATNGCRAEFVYYVYNPYTGVFY